MAREEKTALSIYSGAICVGFTRSGECVVHGFGEIELVDAEQAAKNLVLLAAKIRNAAREGIGMYLFH